jgi:hypothetical protein
MKRVFTIKNWIRIVVISVFSFTLLGPVAGTTGIGADYTAVIPGESAFRYVDSPTSAYRGMEGSKDIARGPSVGGVKIFPADHIWNTRVDSLPVDPRSAAYLSNIGINSYLHADFGSGLYEGNPIGIPCNIVNGSQSKRTVSFEYADESDTGPYPVPDNPLIEGGSDHHLLIIDRDTKMLYELFAAEKQVNGSWSAGSGAVYNLSGYTLRPKGWTSADAAGLAILPGLARYDEVDTGEITHALRFTAPSTRQAYVWPARHFASSITDPAYPPMGQRFRLKSSFNTSGYPYQAQIVLQALKKYGMILSDNGAPWYITGAPDDRWNNDALHTLHQLKGSDFEAVDSSSLMITEDSGQARIRPAFNATSHHIGQFRNGMWYLDYNSDGLSEKTYHFGTTGDVPVTGDWDGNGIVDTGVFRPANGNWYLETTKTGAINMTFHFGKIGDVPVTGAWQITN